MGNLSKKLEVLFRQYLIRKEKERLNPPVRTYNYEYGYCRQNNWMNENDRYDGVIYFYELSDIHRCPTLFYNVGAFDSFLRRYNIFMPPFQKDMIRQLEKAYVTCKTGTHDLLIRGSRELLVEALSRADAPGVDMQTAGQAVMNTPLPAPVGHGYPLGMRPVNPAEIRKPPMYSSNGNHWFG